MVGHLGVVMSSSLFVCFEGDHGYLNARLIADRIMEVALYINIIYYLL